MNDEQLLRNIKSIKNNLESTKRQLKKAQDILNQSINFNNDSFKYDDILSLNQRINKQINNLDNKIIPKINNM